MGSRMLLLMGLALTALVCLRAAGTAPATTLRFEVTCGKGLLAGPRDGRVLVVLAKSNRAEPRLSIGQVGNHSAPVLGKDARAFTAGGVCTLDATSAIFPVEDLRSLPAGTYYAQAV